MITEEPYFDKHGKQINEFAVIKVFHFIGARRKKHYMYKWVRLQEHDGKLYWIARHLMADRESEYYHLRTYRSNDKRILMDTEIVQQIENVNN